MTAAETCVWTWERRFDFDFGVDRAWGLFTDPAETRAWLLPFEEDAQGRSRATIEGQPPVEFAVLEIERPMRLRTVLSGGNVPGRVETTTAFAAAAGGSSASMIHRGFGDADGWARFGDSFEEGWNEAGDDLMVYLKTGVMSPRHIDDRRASIAAWPARRDGAIALVEVFPGGFADQAGMKAGDLLLKLDRMGVYRVADVWAFTRARSAGEEVSATWIRDGRPRTGTGRLSRFEDFGE